MSHNVSHDISLYFIYYNIKYYDIIVKNIEINYLKETTVSLPFLEKNAVRLQVFVIQGPTLSSAVLTLLKNAPGTLSTFSGQRLQRALSVDRLTGDRFQLGWIPQEHHLQ
jgi:hypothetical protein